MLKVGGAIDIIACAVRAKKICDHAQSSAIEATPIWLILLLGCCWQEFLACVRLEMSGKSTKTDFVASYS